VSLPDSTHRPATLVTARPTSLVERWYAVRDRLLQSAAFHRFAARFPLTRSLARKRSRELFDLVAGFVYSQILHACVRLKVLERVAAEPRTAAELAPILGLGLDSTLRLVEGAVALRLLNKRSGGRYGLGDLGAALLGNPGVIAMIEHHALLYQDLADPVALLRDREAPTKLSAYWAYADTQAPGDLQDGRVAEYSRLMAVSQQFIADEILDAYPMRRHRRLLDIGGGEGAFIKAAAARWPHLAFSLFDLPAVAARAATGFQAEGLGARVTACGGDLFNDSLPKGADIACLIRVLYDHERSRALAILRAARAALNPDGVLLIAEPMADTPGAEPVGAAYFGFYLMAMKGGASRSRQELAALALEAGFRSVEPVATRRPLLTSVLIARP
jgi:demethylspheroidene O-methyltransferase